MQDHKTSKTLWKRALERIPGGVNSPVRAFRAVGGTPVFVSSGLGPYLIDVDRHRYVDYVCSWGPLILGHAHPVIVKALRDQVGKGTSFGAATSLEVELAHRIAGAFDHIDKVRLVNSGTEAVMSALRLARAATQRHLIVKMEGGYHGHSDSMLVKAGSGAATFGIPNSAGVTAKTASETLTIPFNNIAAAQEVFDAYGKNIAALIVEPILGNMGLIPPAKGYLKALRGLCTKNKSLLIFDEVITGFRLTYGGADRIFGVRPDLTVLGKIIGGGLPIAAFGGPSSIMDLLAPEGPVYQAGTLSGNPLATRCGIETLKVLSRSGTYAKLEKVGMRVATGLEHALTKAGVPHRVHRMGSMFGIFFTSQPVTDAVSAKTTDTGRYSRWFSALLKRGVYFPPSAFETCFVSLAHGAKEMDWTIKAFEESAMEIS